MEVMKEGYIALSNNG
jgi:DDE superfamily endonuclease